MPDIEAKRWDGVRRRAGDPPPKSIFKSRTFWVNVATTAVALGSGGLGFTMAPRIAIPMLAGANILLRFLTTEPVEREWVKPAHD
jgi:hypothetical protein